MMSSGTCLRPGDELDVVSGKIPDHALNVVLLGAQVAGVCAGNQHLTAGDG